MSNSKTFVAIQQEQMKQETAIPENKTVASKISYLLTYISDIPVMKSSKITNSTQ